MAGHDPRKAGPAPASGPPMSSMPPTATDSRKTHPCGTYAGVQRHNRLGEPVCDDCRTARRDYMREYRRRQGPNADKWWNRTRYEALHRLAEEYPVRYAVILAEVRRESSSMPWRDA